MSLTYYYDSGFTIGIIGIALVPISSIVILSNAKKLRMAKEDEEKEAKRRRRSGPTCRQIAEACETCTAILASDPRQKQDQTKGE